MVSRSGRYTGWASAQEEATLVQLPTLRRLRLGTRNIGSGLSQGFDVAYLQYLLGVAFEHTVDHG